MSLQTRSLSGLFLSALAIATMGESGFAATTWQPTLGTSAEAIQVARRLRLRLGSRPSRYRLGAFRRGATCLPEGAELTALIPPTSLDVEAESTIPDEAFISDEGATLSAADDPLLDEPLSPELTVPVDATVAERPAFFVYIPELEAPTIAQFTLQTDPTDPLAVEELVNVRFTVSGEEGVVGIHLPATASPLELNRQYYWQMSVECNAEKLTENPVISGWVQRVSISEELLPETAAQQALFYAEQGIWQDALSTLAMLRYHHPNNPAVTTDWQELLEAADLSQFAEQPVVQVIELE